MQRFHISIDRAFVKVSEFGRSQGFWIHSLGCLNLEILGRLKPEM
jgi:hypothetical protein